MAIIYTLAETWAIGLVLSLALMLFGGFRAPIVKVIGALILLFFFLLMLGALGYDDPGQRKVLGGAVLLFYAPLGIVLAFLVIIVGALRARRRG